MQISRLWNFYQKKKKTRRKISGLLGLIKRSYTGQKKLPKKRKKWKIIFHQNQTFPSTEMSFKRRMHPKCPWSTAYKSYWPWEVGCETSLYRPSQLEVWWRFHFLNWHSSPWSGMIQIFLWKHHWSRVRFSKFRSLHLSVPGRLFLMHCVPHRRESRQTRNHLRAHLSNRKNSRENPQVWESTTLLFAKRRSHSKALQNDKA